MGTLDFHEAIVGLEREPIAAHGAAAQRRAALAVRQTVAAAATGTRREEVVAFFAESADLGTRAVEAAVRAYLGGLLRGQRLEES